MRDRCVQGLTKADTSASQQGLIWKGEGFLLRHLCFTLYTGLPLWNHTSSCKAETAQSLGICPGGPHGPGQCPGLKFHSAADLGP